MGIRKYRRTYLYLLTVLIGSILLSACAPTLKETIALPEVPDPAATSTKVASGALVFVDQFRDARPSEVMVKMEEKEVKCADDASASVRKALSSALDKRGYELSDLAPIIIAGEVREWTSNVRKGVPAGVDAQSAVYVELFDPANKKIYAGTYQGYATVEKASLSQSDVREALGISMAEAINQILGDKQLLGLLSSY